MSGGLVADLTAETRDKKTGGRRQTENNEAKKKKADFCEDIKVMQGNKLNLYLNIYTADILLW